MNLHLIAVKRSLRSSQSTSHTVDICSHTGGDRMNSHRLNGIVATHTVEKQTTEVTTKAGRNGETQRQCDALYEEM